METKTFDISMVIATRNRAVSLSKMLSSLCAQGMLPAEIVVVDASDNVTQTSEILAEWQCIVKQMTTIKHELAKEIGAAAQRNQGVAIATRPFIWFIDDDVVFESNCVQRLWGAVESDRQLGGVNAMIVNQRYQTPGAISQFIFTLMHGGAEKTFAGRVIGPAINLLPEDGKDLPEVVPVEWLNTTCTMYRREALPTPAFDAIFTGYSFMEDLALSRRVATAGWKLANVRHAQIFHHSQSAANKQDIAAMAFMELRNRRYVMTEILNRRTFSDYLRLGLWECFTIASDLTSTGGFRNLPKVLAGKLRALFAPGSSAKHFRTS